MKRASKKAASASSRASTRSSANKHARTTAARGATTSKRAGSRPTATKLDERGILKKLRALCLALPDASETATFGHPTFQRDGKTFCVLEEYKRELCIVFKAELPAQQALIQSPRFFTAPYIGKHGWVSLRATGDLEWGEIEDLVTASHALVAKPRTARPKKPGRNNAMRVVRAATVRPSLATRTRSTNE
jgi:predicted DNA-binding protein (MmcQ/YjbR family)